MLIVLLLAGLSREALCLNEERGAIVSGVVKDGTGAVIEGARIWLRNAQQSTVGSGTTNEEGKFRIADVPPGSYEMVVNAHGFAERRVVLKVASTQLAGLNLTLEPALISEAITVTAEAGLIQEKRNAVQPVNVIGEQQLAERAKAVLAQAVTEEAGLQLQRTSPTIGGLYIRGLGGNKVNVYVDGIRYSTSAARGGINTFLNLIDPSNLGTIEVIRGPKSADYGSDAIAGSLQLVTHTPAVASSGLELHGSWGTFFDSADSSFGSSLRTSLATRRFGLTTNFVGRRINRLRPGRGIDSHSAVTRFLGLPSDILSGSRLPDTAFTQYGGLLNLSWSPRPTHSVSVQYQRGQQDGSKRYDQLLGGDGNRIADLRNLMLDFFYIRYDKQSLGWFDNITLSYSFNAQREERVNQGGNGEALAAIVHQYEKTRAHGFQVRGDKIWKSLQLRLGAEIYHEHIRSPSRAFDPAAGTVMLRRPRVPDRARYRSWGLYAQDSIELIGNRLKLVGALRYSGALYQARTEDAPVVDGAPLWPGESLRVDDLTGRAGALLRLGSGWSAWFHFSRGFRAPHMTDLGTLGLTGSGFEVAAPEASRLGGEIGSTAGSDADSTGRPVQQLDPEISYTYDLGVRYYHQRVRVELAGFINSINGLSQKQALILPPGAVGQTLGGEPIVAQNANGVVFVQASTNPVLVRANFGDARFWGLEQTVEVALTRGLLVNGTFTFIRAENKETGNPPNVPGGVPPSDGWLRFRTHSGGRFWIEPFVHLVARQNRMSSLMLRDRRIGSARSLDSIARFFRNGATVRGLVGAGPDGLTGTVDDVLLPTGETLPEVQRRVLGSGLSPSSLFVAIPGYVTFNVRGGVQLSESQQLMMELENLFDRNYRGVGWGLDGPGRSLFVRYTFRF